MLTFAAMTTKTKRNSVTFDAEIAKLREIFESVEDKRAKNASHKLSDIFMSGFFMFSFKHASLT